jgi:hypothetical protein
MEDTVKKKKLIILYGEVLVTLDVVFSDPLREFY